MMQQIAQKIAAALLSLSVMERLIPAGGGRGKECLPGIISW
jgi:hypothetical protein